MTSPAPEVRLGVRLAAGGSGRGRTVLVALAAALGAAVLLSVFTAASTRLDRAGSYDPSERLLLLGAITASVALPVVVLAATVGRLSAAVRDRRLANLRLLGLSSRQTRTVAAVEAGVGAVTGTVVGVLVALVVRPLVTSGAGSSPGAFEVAQDPVVPTWWSYVAVLLVLPAVSVGVAALPQRLDPVSVLARAARHDVHRPSPWRLLPLLLGVVVCAWIGRGVGGGDDVSDLQVLVLATGICLTALGLVVVAPVYVRLAADLLMRVARGPATLMAARRLQAQPASVTRVVAALMVGLFLVAGGRAVLGAFESTPQYVVADWALDRPYLVTLTAETNEDTDQIVTDISKLGGVRSAEALPVVSIQCGPTPDDVCGAVVASCTQLQPYLDASTTTCRDDEVQWADRPVGSPAAAALTARAQRGTDLSDASVAVPSPGATILSTRAEGIEGSLADLPFAVRIPPTITGIDTLTATTDRVVFISAAPGPGVVDTILATDHGSFALTGPSFDDHDFVATLRTIIWTLAAVILSVGLLTFAIAAIDRASSRRREVTGLLLLGVPPRTIRRAQLLETCIPVAGGSLLSIAAGLLAGSSYLGLVGDSQYTPWSPTLVLAACSLAASAAIAGLTVVGSRDRISPTRIRTE